jgi:hypothetical protein
MDHHHTSPAERQHEVDVGGNRWQAYQHHRLDAGRQEIDYGKACLQNVPRSRHLLRPQFGDVQTEVKTEMDTETPRQQPQTTAT